MTTFNMDKDEHTVELSKMFRFCVNADRYNLEAIYWLSKPKETEAIN